MSDSVLERVEIEQPAVHIKVNYSIITPEFLFGVNLFEIQFLFKTERNYFMGLCGVFLFFTVGLKHTSTLSRNKKAHREKH